MVVEMVSPDFLAQLARKIDGKTKPQGSLGRVEALASQVACLQNTLSPKMCTCQLIIFAGDHGIAAEGVSAYPQTVTRQMVENFLRGGAAANVFAETMDMGLQVVDAGIAGPVISHPVLLTRRMATGTRNFLHEPAMSQQQLERSIEIGAELGANCETDAVCFGEMGIANTSSAALVAHKILNIPIVDLTGRGTGIDDDGLARKTSILERAASRVPGSLDANSALLQYGGFEIAMMTGAIINAAAARKLVLIDGFIASVAALAAAELAPACRRALVFAHRSKEHGHGAVLSALQATPLFDFGMRLGEGTGAILAWPIIKAAVAMLNDMASFESAGVDGRT